MAKLIRYVMDPVGKYEEKKCPSGKGLDAYIKYELSVLLKRKLFLILPVTIRYFPVDHTDIYLESNKNGGP